MVLTFQLNNYDMKYMTSLYEISYYRIEQHIHTEPAHLALFVYRAYYMTLFNTFALHAGCWSSGMTLALHGVRMPRVRQAYNTPWHRLFFLLLTAFCTFSSLFPIMANIFIFLSHWHFHMNVYYQLSQFMRRCKALQIGDICVSCYQER